MKNKISKIFIDGLISFMLTGCQTNPPPQIHYHFVFVELALPQQIPNPTPVVPYNEFKPRKSCRLTCFSYNEAGARYPLEEKVQGKTIYVKGFVNVKGQMDTRFICRPEGYDKADISKVLKFKQLCQKAVPTCGSECWAGGQ